MIKLIIILLLICISSFAKGKGLDPEQREKEVIYLITSGKIQKAFDKAFEGSETSTSNKKEDITKLMLQFKGIVTIAGIPDKCELLEKRNLIDRWRSSFYLCLSKLQPFIIQFDFYRYKNEWKLQAFAFDTGVSKLIDESFDRRIGDKSIIKN